MITGDVFKLYLYILVECTRTVTCILHKRLLRAAGAVKGGDGSARATLTASWVGVEVGVGQ